MGHDTLLRQDAMPHREPVTVEERLFREMGAGGYSRQDHRMEYIVRVNALLRPDMRVMEFGAGRGKWSHDPVPLRRQLGDFRGRCAHVTVEERLFREMGAGGYSRQDHRMEYIVRVNALLRPDMRVMEFGAGRGKWSHDPVPLRRQLGDFRGRCAHVTACDVDEAVLGNETADSVQLVGHDGLLPFPDASFDLISAFSVLEHIETPERTAQELGRILAPGGWLCAWTPNRWGYVGVGARLVPKRLHARVLRLVEPRRVEIDSFVPLYTMNTEGARKRLFPTDRFEHFTYAFDGQPFYHGENIVLGKFWELLFRLTPGPFKGYHMVFIRKR